MTYFYHKEKEDAYERKKCINVHAHKQTRIFANTLKIKPVNSFQSVFVFKSVYTQTQRQAPFYTCISPLAYRLPD